MFITAFDPVWDRPSFAGAVGGFALEATRYMALTGATQEDAARVTVRDRRHALNNPYAHLRLELTVEDVMKSPMIAYPLKHLFIFTPSPRVAGRGEGQGSSLEKEKSPWKRRRSF